MKVSDWGSIELFRITLFQSFHSSVKSVSNLVPLADRRRKKLLVDFVEEAQVSVSD